MVVAVVVLVEVVGDTPVVDPCVFLLFSGFSCLFLECCWLVRGGGGVVVSVLQS